MGKGACDVPIDMAIEFVGHAPLCPTYCFLDILQL